MKKLVSTVMVLAFSCIAGEASAKTVSLGVLPSGTSVVGDGVRSGGFADSFKFQEKTHGSWGSGSLTASNTFADLAAGRYRFEAIGFAPARYGHYSADITVAAVPETETWMMLLIGAGMVAYQLRRKQNSLPRQPIAPPG